MPDEKPLRRDAPATRVTTAEATQLRRRVLRLTAALVFAATLTACVGGGTQEEGCAGYADNPHISEPSHSIVAKSRTYCAGVRAVQITMSLEQNKAMSGQLSEANLSRSSIQLTVHGMFGRSPHNV